jgi:predicted metalloprotease
MAARRSTAVVVALGLVVGGGVAAGCGGSDGGASTGAQSQVERGKELFAQRCGGCHTLSAAGTRGTRGVDFDQREVDRADALFAIRNGGFGSKVMPANIVAGEDAEAVAAFLAKVSGRDAATTPDAALESPAVRTMRAPIAAAAAPDPATGGGPTASAEFLRQAFDSAQDMWAAQFARGQTRYAPAHVVFFHTQIHTPCGVQSATTGPFYCPAALSVNLNTDFFEALAQAYRLRSGFAAGYVTAHEVGHHVQHLLGLHERVARLDASDPQGANRRSIAVELQADCYAGVWLHELDGAGALGEDDIRDIVQAATVVGDDYQRNRAGVELAPETWTHGSSAERVRWLTVGLRSGAPAACDTFTAAE